MLKMKSFSPWTLIWIITSECVLKNTQKNQSLNADDQKKHLKKKSWGIK